MKHFLVKSALLSLATALVLTTVGCSGGGSSGGGGTTGSSTASSTGSASKGPFKQHSLVVAYKLKSDGTRDTNATTYTTDDRGHFSFDSLPWTGPTELVISGEYFNENSGTYMLLPPDKGLSAVVDLPAGSVENVNINIFTDIAAKSTIAAMAQGNDISTAKTQAEENVKKVFNLDLPSGASLEDLDPTDASKNTKANTQLLMVSSALLQADDPHSVMEALSTGLSDGEVDNDAAMAIDAIKTEITNVDIKKVAAQMEEKLGVSNPPSDVESTLQGLLALDNNLSFSPVTDAYRNTPYTSNEITVDKIYGGTGTISITGGEYSINGTDFTSTAGTVSNGQKVKIKLISSSDYSTKSTATLTIGGADIPFSVTTKSDPFIPDTSPDAFSFGYKANQNVSTTGNDNIVTSDPIVVTGINTPTSVSISSNVTATFDINGTTASNGDTVQNGDTIKVHLVASSNFGDKTTATITIGDKNATFTVFTVAKDTIPDPVSFDDVNDVEPDANVTSNSVTITGINTSTEISIEGGEYQVTDARGNAGSFTNQNGTVNLNDRIIVKLTASPNYSTTKTAKLTIGDMVLYFNVKTKSDPHIPDTTPDPLPTLIVVDQNISTDVTTPPFTVTGINEPVRATVTNGYFDINASDGDNWVTDANVSSGDTIRIRQTTADTFDTTKTTTLTIGGVQAVFKTTTVVKDTLPDTISFDTNDSVHVGDTNVTSNTVTITGINTDVNISINNGEYSINGGAFTDSEETIHNGNTLTLRQPQVASTPETANVTVVTIGSFTTTFTTVTLPAAPKIDSNETNATALEDSYFSFQPHLDTTTGGSATSWSISNKPKWAEFNTITGLLSGTPTNDDVGTYSGIVITATNAVGSDTYGPFDIVVQNVNDAPVASDINITTNEDTNFTIDTSSYVHDDDINDSYTLTSTDPANGSVDINGTTMVYIPNANYFGSDTFTYTVKDEANATASATVHVLIASIPDPAIISGTFNAVIEANATAPASANVHVEDGDPGEQSIIPADINASYGLFHINSDGSWSYALDPSKAEQLAALAAGESVVDSAPGAVVSYDGNTSRDLNVTIYGVNDAPVAVSNDLNLTVKVNNTISATLHATDVDHNAVLTFTNATVTATNATDTAGSVSIDANGTFTYTAPASISPAPLSVTLTFSVSDEHNATAIGTQHITVVLSDPPVANPDSVTIDEDTNTTIDVLANDTDDNNATLTIVSVTQPSHGTATIENNGTALLYVPEANFNGNDLLSYTIQDPDGGTSDANVSITVNPVNDIPVAVDDNIILDEDSNATFNVLGNDSDEDNDTLQVTAVTQPNNGNISYDANGSMTYIPNANFNGSDSVIYTVSDGTAETNATVNFTVLPQNDAPVIAPIGTITMDEDANATFVDLNITDVDDTNLTIYVSSSDPSKLAATLQNDGNGSYQIELVPQPNQYGNINVSVAADDGNATASLGFTVVINPVNDAPEIVEDTFYAQANTTTQLDILANDTDVDGDNLSIVSCDANSSLGASVTTDHAIVTYNAGDINGTDTFTCSVSDGNVTVDELVTVNVSTNHAPRAGDAAITMIVGETISGNIGAEDPDGDPLDYNVTGMDNGSIFGSATTLDTNGNYTIEANATGHGVIYIDISDGKAVTSIQLDVDIISPQQAKDPYEFSEGGEITQADFNNYASISHPAIPSDTKLYGFWGTDTNESNATVLHMGYIMFDSNGTFEMFDDGELQLASHDDNLSGTVHISKSPTYDASALMAQGVLVDDNVSISEIPELSNLTFPEGVQIYKLAIMMMEDEYDLWESAKDCSVNPCVEYTSLDDVAQKGIFGIVDYNHLNNNRVLAFAPDENLSDGNGTIVEVDMTNYYNNGGDPFIINANAGTWTLTKYEDNTTDMILVTVDDALMPSYNKHPILVAPGVQNEDGSTTNVVMRGSFQPAGSSFIDYRFNDVAAAVIQNSFYGPDAQEWIDTVQDQNGSDINATEFDALGNGLINPDGSELYELEVDMEYNENSLPPVPQFEVTKIVLTNGTVNIYSPDENESYSYSVDNNNIVTVSTSVLGQTVDIYKLKIVEIFNASEITDMTRLVMPEGAQMYKLAGLELVNSIEYWEDENGNAMHAEARDANGTLVGTDYTDLDTFVSDARIANQHGFMKRYDETTQTEYALGFDGNTTSGNLLEVNLSDGNTTVAGTWEIQNMTIGGVASQDVLLIHPTSYQYSSDLCFAANPDDLDQNNNPIIDVGEITLKDTGDIFYHTNKAAADIINAHFTNKYSTVFTQHELAGKTYYGVDTDGTQYVASYEVYGSYRNFEIGTFDFTNPEHQEFVLQGNQMTITGSNVVITRTANYGTWSVVSVDDGNGNTKTVYWFENRSDAENYLNSLQQAP